MVHPYLNRRGQGAPDCAPVAGTGAAADAQVPLFPAIAEDGDDRGDLRGEAEELRRAWLKRSEKRMERD
jgi:hypothetical protein